VSEDAALWAGFQRAHRAVSRELESALEQRYELSLSALELLVCLAVADQHRLRLSQLAARVELSLSRVSRIVDALARRRLVYREPCPDDSRATFACLTAAGVAVAVDAGSAYRDGVRRRFADRLDERESAILSDVFARLAG
jgi:DNA-binding MarR family transcriptional regulator